MWLWVCESVFACISVRMLCAHETDRPVIRYLGEWPVTGPGWKHWKLAVLFPGYWISSCLLVEMWRTLSFRGKVWFPTHALVSFKWNSWPQVTTGSHPVQPGLWVIAQGSIKTVKQNDWLCVLSSFRLCLSVIVTWIKMLLIFNAEIYSCNCKIIEFLYYCLQMNCIQCYIIN